MEALLHIPTLLLTASLGTFCLAIALGTVWRGARNEAALAAWSGGFLLATVALLLLALRSHISSTLSVNAANAMLLLSYGLNWLGYRLFAGQARRSDIVLASLGMFCWIAFGLAGELFANINNRMLFISVAEAAYLLPAIWSLGGPDRSENLPSIRPTQFVMAAYAGLQVLRAVYTLAAPLPPHPIGLPNNGVIGAILMGSALFSILLGLLQLSLSAQRAERQFRIAAETDVLTGLSNRRRLQEALAPALASDSVQGALVFFDIDHFKRINDGYGHLAGDRALIRFAEALADEAPAGSLAARVGGEEFALFLPGTNTAMAAVVADGVRRRASDLRIAVDGVELRLTVSCGVAGIREAGNCYETLWSAADEALYKAKNEGRDRVTVYHWRPSTTRTAIASGTAANGGAMDETQAAFAV